MEHAEQRKTQTTFYIQTTLPQFNRSLLLPDTKYADNHSVPIQRTTQTSTKKTTPYDVAKPARV